MPQGHRKNPFSAKQKKIQLQQKREKKRNYQDAEAVSSEIVSSSNAFPDLEKTDSKNSGPVSLDELVSVATTSKQGRGRYALMFQKETKDELQKKKVEAFNPFTPLPNTALEVSYEDIYNVGNELDIPVRPPWSYKLSKEVLEAKENGYFRDYVSKLNANKAENLSYFELNLETWRQLWRVFEMSDILLVIADIRHPVLHFPPSLYRHITNDLNKTVILVLNKIDLVPASIVLAWQDYFLKKFSGLKVLLFSSVTLNKAGGNKKYKRCKQKMAVAGAKRLLSLCEEVVQDKIDLSSWHQKIEEESQSEDFEESNPLSDCATVEQKETGFVDRKRFQDNILTLGFVGHPNVGKSSLLNALMGKKVVSVSRTPGHTKHFQTIFITKNVRFCDCPGLVFPSYVPKPLQVLSGCFPIAQLQEPYSVMTFLAERLQIVKILKLKHPEQTVPYNQQTWSTYELCEAYAEKRGFRTAKAARLDVNRAANFILRMVLDGRTLCLAFVPPGYTQNKLQWENHAMVQEIQFLQFSKKSDTTEESSLQISGYKSEDAVDSEDISSDSDRASDEN